MIPYLLMQLGAPNPHGFIAQVPVEVALTTPGTVRTAQLPVEYAYGALGTFRSAELVVEVLRKMHCVTSNPIPPGPPVSTCPPVNLTGTATGGCVEEVDFTGTAAGGCVAAVDPL